MPKINLNVIQWGIEPFLVKHVDLITVKLPAEFRTNSSIWWTDWKKSTKIKIVFLEKLYQKCSSFRTPLVVISRSPLQRGTKNSRDRMQLRSSRRTRQIPNLHVKCWPDFSGFSPTETTRRQDDWLRRAVRTGSFQKRPHRSDLIAVLQRRKSQLENGLHQILFVQNRVLGTVTERSGIPSYRRTGSSIARVRLIFVQ